MRNPPGLSGDQDGNRGFDSDLLQPLNPEEEDAVATFCASGPQLPTAMTSRTPAAGPPPGDGYDRQQFWIRLANTPERREHAALLVDRLYARRGYINENILRGSPVPPYRRGK